MEVSKEGQYLSVAVEYRMTLSCQYDIVVIKANANLGGLRLRYF